MQYRGGRVGAIILEQPLEPVYKLGARSQIRGATLMLYVPLVHLVAEVLWVILCFRIDGIDHLSWMCWKLVFVDVFVGSLVLVILCAKLFLLAPFVYVFNDCASTGQF